MHSFLLNKQIKKALSHIWDKTLNPAVPPKLPDKPTARFLYLHISRSDNGYGTRRRYSQTLSCRPHKSIRCTLPCGISTDNRSLQALSKATLLNHRFFRCCHNVITPFFLCQEKITNIFKSLFMGQNVLYRYISRKNALFCGIIK